MENVNIQKTEEKSRIFYARMIDRWSFKIPFKKAIIDSVSRRAVVVVNSKLHNLFAIYSITIGQ
jgi:hypothetical protein